MLLPKAAKAAAAKAAPAARSVGAGGSSSGGPGALSSGVAWALAHLEGRPGGQLIFAEARMKRRITEDVVSKSLSDKMKGMTEPTRGLNDVHAGATRIDAINLTYGLVSTHADKRRNAGQPQYINRAAPMIIISSVGEPYI